GWPSTITAGCIRRWATSARCSTSSAGTRHSVKRPREPWVKSYTKQGQGQWHHVAREQRELHQLFHHIHDAVVIGRGLHASRFIELLVCLGDRRLVRDGQHPHPATQHAHLIDG